jgi:hypothetical protein
MIYCGKNIRMADNPETDSKTGIPAKTPDLRPDPRPLREWGNRVPDMRDPAAFFREREPTKTGFTP